MSVEYAAFVDRLRHLRATDPRYGKLRDIAASIGVEVHAARLDPPFRGFYDHRKRQIVLEETLTRSEILCVLAHEVGHALEGHRGYRVEAQEYAADSWAADFLLGSDGSARHDVEQHLIDNWTERNAA